MRTHVHRISHRALVPASPAALSRAVAAALQCRPRRLLLGIGVLVTGMAMGLNCSAAPATFPAVIPLPSLDGTDGFLLHGIETGDRAAGVSGAGDVNGDGINDLLIGAPTASDTGDSYVVLGRGPPAGN